MLLFLHGTYYTEAIIAVIGSVVWLLLIIALHFVDDKLRPGYRMVSEYARGRFGWLMQLAFFCMAIACIATVLAIEPYLSLVSIILLIPIGISFAGAGVFVTDPVFVEDEYSTRSGNLHNLFAAIAILLYPLMIRFVNMDIKDADFTRNDHNVLVMLEIIAWVAWGAFIAAMIRTRQNKRIPFGYFQRFMIFSFSAWLIMAAFLMTQQGF